MIKVISERVKLSKQDVQKIVAEKMSIDLEEAKKLVELVDWYGYSCFNNIYDLLVYGEGEWAPSEVTELKSDSKYPNGVRAIVRFERELSDDEERRLSSAKVEVLVQSGNDYQVVIPDAKSHLDSVGVPYTLEA